MFVPSLKLARTLYETEIAPLMEKQFPDVKYAAATYGMCSETLGLDDEVSMDHQWGPRVNVLVSDQDHSRYSQQIMAAFRESFPAQFQGFDMMWAKSGGDWFPIGRIGSRGDTLGLRLQISKVVQHIMHIAFMVSKSYMPYKKWFGTLFKTLPVAAALEPVLLDLLHEQDWQQAEEKIGHAVSILLERQNTLGLGSEITLGAETVDDGRHHIKHDFWEIGQQLTQDIHPDLKAVMDNQVFWLHERALILWNGEVGKWSLLLQKEGDEE